MIASGSRDNTIKLWTVDLDDLIAEGCSWVSDYLKNNPYVTEDERSLCGVEASATAWFLQGEQSAARRDNIDEAVSKFRQAVKLDSNFSLSSANILVKKGESLASTDRVDAAILAFQAALEFDSSLKFKPENKATAIAAILEGRDLAENGKIDEALAKFEKAQKLDANEISAWDWNSLCWNGSLNQQAEKVMFACENAVKLSPKNGNYINNRGLARALTGDFEGAIKDFEKFVEWTNDEEEKAQRQGWIESLKKGENPFTEEVLEKLR